MKLIDFITDLGMDAVKDRVVDIKKQQEIRERLEAYILRQAKIYELCTTAEEIDFQGVADYITGNLIDDVKKRLFGEKEERETARKTIISKAVDYSCAHEEMAKKRVANLVADAMDILREYYRSQVDKNLLFMSAELQDNIEHSLKEHEQKITDEVKKIKENEMSIDGNIKLLKQGKFDEVESNIKSFYSCIGSVHSLYPYYVFAPENINGEVQLFSKPLSLEAIEKYPPNIMCRATIQLGNQQINQFDIKTFEYANRHQMPISINILEAKKLLGDIDDPVQHEAKELVGKNVVIPPKPFPAPSPCCIIIDDTIEFEYILLRTQEVLEDGTIIISNQEQQKYPFKILIKTNTPYNKMEFNISTKNPSNRDVLKYVRFMKKISKGANLKVRLLSSGQDLMKGMVNPFICESGFEIVDKEIEFLEKIVLIEDYFNKSIILPREIFKEDYETIYYMADLITGDGYNGSWTKTEFTFKLDANLQKNIAEMNETLYSISYVGNIDISLYGEQYHFKVKRTYERVKTNNLEKLKKKAEILDIGDTIRIEYIPGEGSIIGSFIDMLVDKT